MTGGWIETCHAQLSLIFGIRNRVSLSISAGGIRAGIGQGPGEPG